MPATRNQQPPSLAHEDEAPSLGRLPGLTRELVEGLDALVPEQPEREIWMYAGKRELVRNLITVLERQERERTRNPHLGLMPRLS